MFPASFDYECPSSLQEALGLLAEHGDEAKVMAGGQSLIPLLKLRLAAPGVVVDIGRLPGLTGIDADAGGLTIGARTRHVDVERSGVLRGLYPILVEAAPQISDPLVRNAGTVGGSICHADPAGDWGAVMLALDAEFVVRSARGERTIPAAGFFDGPYTTVLEPDEILTAIRVPAPAGSSGGAYLKLERKVGDFATAAVAVQVELADGHIERAGIGLTSVGPTNLRATRAEEALSGATPDDAVIDEAARLAAAACEPHSDVRGSADYKRDVVRVFVKRGLRRAIARAQSGGVS
ncbi:MAG TPA: xanthine dehydrogenase family protein subunit M [Candidatus Dormibacteraeota bacterium]|nr:xanthine dehydrogenase family protein subunit M [Candidatus Dormibacteraeota bacterium]